MAQIKRLDPRLLGDFNISLEPEDFTFFQVERGLYTEAWDLIGADPISVQEKSFRFLFLHIDEDQLSWDHFVAEEEVSGYFQCTPDEYSSLIRFLELFLEHSEEEEKSRFGSSFLPLSDEELLKLRYPPHLLKARSKRHYRYLFGETSADPFWRIVSFPVWSTRYREHQVSFLRLRSFFLQQLDDSHFNPWSGVSGFQVLPCTQQTLKEFIALLKEHALV